MELKSLEDWTVEKQFKSVPDVVDVASFGGTDARVPGARRSGQARRLRAQPRPGGAAARQQQRQRRRQLHRGGPAADQRPRRRAGRRRRRHRADGHRDEERHAAARRETSRRSTQGPKIRLGQFGKAIHRADGTILDNDDVVEGIVLLRKGADADADARRDPREGEGAQRAHPAARRQDRAVPRPQRPGALHDAHGAAQPDRRDHPRRGRSCSCSSATCAARSSSR